MTNVIAKTIRENERFFHHVLKLAGLGTYVMDIPAGTFHCSEILNDIFGLPKEYPRTYEGWVALLHPDDRQMMADYFTRDVVGSGRRFDKEYRIIRVVDGAERWVHGHGDLELDANHKPVLMTGTVQDITERKRSEKALQQSESRYRELINLAVDGILIGSNEGGIVEANQRMCELTGLSREELVGRHVSELPFTPESLAAAPFRFDLLRQGKAVVNERQLQRRDGVVIDVEMRTKMMPDGTYQSIYRDVTERKKAELALRDVAATLARNVDERTQELKQTNDALTLSMQRISASQVLLNEMGRTAKVGGWELDIRTGKQVWTEEVYQIHEVGPEFDPTIGNGILFYVPAARPVIEDAVRRCIESGEPFDLELEFVTARGKTLWVNAIGRADLEHGRIHGTFQDVTERRRADDALREKNTALDQSLAQLRKLAMELTQAEERERKRLAAILHDHVQQYIAAATMKISLLGGPLSPDEHGRYVQDALALLGEALNASRTLTVSLCPPVLLEAGLMPGLRWLAGWIHDKHGLNVKVTGGDGVGVEPPLCILLFQAVRELLFNIVKHAGVTQASVSVDQPDPAWLRIVVADEGHGFLQHESLASVHSGGFGLFHLRERLSYIGGSLEVTSEYGKGTRVVIKTPL